MASNHQAKPNEQLTPNQQARLDLANVEEALKSCRWEFRHAKEDLKKSVEVCRYHKPDSRCTELSNLYDRIQEQALQNYKNEHACMVACVPLRKKTLLDKWLCKWGYRNPQDTVGFLNFLQCQIGCLQKSMDALEQLRAEMKKHAQEDSAK